MNALGPAFDFAVDLPAQAQDLLDASLCYALATSQAPDREELIKRFWPWHQQPGMLGHWNLHGAVPGFDPDPAVISSNAMMAAALASAAFVKLLGGAA